MKVILSSALPIIVVVALGLFSTSTIFGQNQVVKDQVVISQNNLKNYTDVGDFTQTDYRETFNPFKAFDNLLRSEQVKHTAWSNHGDVAGFTVNLNNPLEKAICSADIISYKPQNSPFNLTVGNKTVNGILDSTVKQVTFGSENQKNCAANVDKIKLDVQGKGTKWTSIEEIKLFAEKTIPDIEPPVCEPGYYWDATLKQCVKIDKPINNATVVLNVSNSSVLINADDSTKIKIVTLQENEEEEAEEAEEEQEEQEEESEKKGDDKN